jgi:hypothetical protein
VAILANFTVTFNPKPKKTAVREEAGTPVITDTKGNTYTLKHAIANPAVIFAPDNTALTEEGTYSVSIPAGYIVTTDSDGLEAEARNQGYVQARARAGRQLRHRIYGSERGMVWP